MPLTRSLRCVRTLTPVLAWLLAAPGVAAAQASGFPGFALHVEQDVFFPPADDQDYTMGVQFTWHRSTHLQGTLRATDFLIGHVPRLLHRRWGEADGTARRATAFHFGNSAFAPLKGENGSNLARSDPIFDDRPYASLLYVRAQRWSALGANALSTELTVGVLGLDVAKATQIFIHEHISDDVRPGGWHHQISDGGELTAAYRASYRRRLLSRLWNDEPGRRPFGLEAVGMLEGSVGYYTNAALGGRVRIGWWDAASNPWWLWERMPIPAVVPRGAMAGPARPAGATLADVRGGDEGGFWEALKPSEGFVYLAAGQTLWGYNALMQGQWRESEVTLDFDDRGPGTTHLRRWIGDLRVGATVRWTRIGAGYYMTFQGPAFSGPRSRSHRWGGIHVIVYDLP